MSIPGEKVSVYSVPTQPTRPSAHIGVLLVDSGKLTQDEADRVVQAQREKGLRFGDAAVRLGLLTASDVEQALSRQFEFSYLVPGTSGISGEIVAAYAPFDHKVEVFKAIRSQLMLRWFNAQLGMKHLAIVSPCRGEGRSYFAANLAVVFSQLGERTLLIDADMRHPQQHQLFNLENKAGLSTLLAGRSDRSVIEHIVPLLDLSVLPSGPVPPNPQELLSRPLFRKLLADLAEEYDVVILDSPAGDMHADAQLIAATAGGAFMVVRRNFTPVRAMREFSECLSGVGCPVTGSVINNV